MVKMETSWKNRWWLGIRRCLRHGQYFHLPEQRLPLALPHAGHQSICYWWWGASGTTVSWRTSWIECVPIAYSRTWKKRIELGHSLKTEISLHYSPARDMGVHGRCRPVRGRSLLSVIHRMWMLIDWGARTSCFPFPEEIRATRPESNDCWLSHYHRRCTFSKSLRSWSPTRIWFRT